ncbi:MAG TPA: DUF494 family protein [Bacteroidota bacterium]
MYEKVVEIIVYLMTEIHQNKQLGEIDLSSLSRSGYTETEISSALSWIFDKFSVGDAQPVGNASPSSQSFRIFHEAEKMSLSVKAQGYLIQLRALALLSDLDFELVIDRVMRSGFLKAGLPEVKSIVASVLFNNEDAPNAASRFLLNSSDTIQ